VLHNNQSPWTVVLVIPNKAALAEAVKEKGLDPASEAGLKAQLDIIKGEVDSYRPGGRHAGLFPEKWLPAAIIVGETPFTEQNGMLNTTSKMVRGKVEKFYKERIDILYSADGKNLYEQHNLDAFK
jgi:long-chain acyl-CoA synthetase